MAADVLQITRLSLKCQITDRADLSAGRDRLERVATDVLPKAIGACLRTALPADWRDGDTVLALPKIELSLDIDLDADPSLVAQAWARALTQAILRTIGGTQTVRFDTSAARMAAFVCDLVAGQAWQRWYWKDFDGLKPLETSAALRTALLRDGTDGLSAWRLLQSGNIAQCLDALNMADAFRLQAGLAANHVPNQQPDDIIFTRTALRAVRFAPVSALRSAAHFALWLAGAADTDAPAPDIVGQDALALAGLALDPDMDLPRLMVQAQQAISADASTRGALTSAQEQRLRSVVAQAQVGHLPEAPQVHADTVCCESTPFGGAFLLWPHLMNMPLDAICEDWPSPGRCGAAQALRMVVLTRIFGPSMTSRLLSDPALNQVFLPDRPTVPDFCAWADDLGEYVDASRIKRILDGWGLQEGVRGAQWRSLTPQGFHALKADAQGYWLRLQDDPEPHPLLDEAPVVGDVKVDKKDHQTLCDAQTHPLVSQLAQICVKRLLWCIPGFANASVTHALQNLLMMPATLVQDGSLYVVQLGSAPLSIMLNLTGLSRQTFTLADGGRVRLSQRGGT